MVKIVQNDAFAADNDDTGDHNHDHAADGDADYTDDGYDGDDGGLGRVDDYDDALIGY